jgi:hypothetical protein
MIKLWRSCQALGLARDISQLLGHLVRVGRRSRAHWETSSTDGMQTLCFWRQVASKALSMCKVHTWIHATCNMLRRRAEEGRRSGARSGVWGGAETRGGMEGYAGSQTGTRQGTTVESSSSSAFGTHIRVLLAGRWPLSGTRARGLLPGCSSSYPATAVVRSRVSSFLFPLSSSSSSSPSATNHHHHHHHHHHCHRSFPFSRSERQAVDIYIVTIVYW